MKSNIFMSTFLFGISKPVCFQYHSGYVALFEGERNHLLCTAIARRAASDANICFNGST